MLEKVKYPKTKADNEKADVRIRRVFVFIWRIIVFFYKEGKLCQKNRAPLLIRFDYTSGLALENQSKWGFQGGQPPGIPWGLLPQGIGEQVLPLWQNR